MSKITFRADDDLIARLEEFNASKSEVMREALREYLGEADGTASGTKQQTLAEDDSINEIFVDRVDDIIEDRLDQRLHGRRAQDVNVNIALEHDGEATVSDADSDDVTDIEHESSPTTDSRKTGEATEGPTPIPTGRTCTQCGDDLTKDHVYCPNCGEKAARRVFCECGDELQSDWGFCPNCGRRTPAADVLDGG